MTIGEHIKNNISNKSFKFLSKVMDDIATNILSTHDDILSYKVYESSYDLADIVPYEIEDSDDIWNYIKSDKRLNELLEKHEKWLEEEGLEIFLLTYTTECGKSAFYILIEVKREHKL